MHKNILVIDDDKTLQHLLGGIFEKEGYVTLSAGNGREGLAVLQVEKVDLIVLDILMPIMDGFEFFKELKLNPLTHDIPVLVLTVRTKMEDAFMSLGAEAFMAKPVNREKLLTEIKEILDHAHVKRLPSKEKSTNPNSDMPSVVSRSQLEKINGTLNSEPRQILVAGAVDKVVGFMVDSFKEKGYTAEVVNNSDDLISKATRYQPDVILLEINLDATSVHEVTTALEKIAGYRPLILLYSVFQTRENEKNSILDTLYNNQYKKPVKRKLFGFGKKNRLPGGEPSQANPMVHYLGAFHKESFLNKVGRYFPLK